VPVLKTSAEVTDDTFLAYKEVRSLAVYGEAELPVNPEQTSDFERAGRETFDQYLTVAKKRGFTKRRQLLQLLDNYGVRDDLGIATRPSPRPVGSAKSLAVTAGPRPPVWRISPSAAAASAVMRLPWTRS
jgi:hypothetical protein